MRIHILGAGGGAPAPGGASPAYLVETDQARILLDCGPGVVARLLTVCSLDALDAVVLSHLHPDHLLDVVTLAYGLLVRAQTIDQAVTPLRIPLHLPRGETATLAAVSAAFGHPDWRFRTVAGASPAYRTLLLDAERTPDFLLALLPPVEYDLVPNAPIARYGDCVISAAPVDHGPPTASLRVASPAGIFVYSADTGPCAELADFAHGADLFLCEAMAAGDKGAFYTTHLTPSQAGAMAQAAGVRALALTHLPPGADHAEILAEARAAFGGPTSIVTEGDILPVRHHD